MQAVANPVVSNRKISLHSLFAILATVSKMSVAFISIPICIEYLGAERFGLWTIALTTLSFVHILDAGLTPSIKNKLLSSFALENQADFEFFFRVSLYISIFLFGLFFFAAVPLYLIEWGSIFNIREQIAIDESKTLMVIVAFVVSSTLALANIENYFAARLMLGKVKIIDTALNILSLPVLYVAVQLKASLPMLALIYSSPPILVRLGLLSYLIATKPKLFKLQGVDITYYRSAISVALKEGVPFLGIKVCEFSINVLPNLYLAHIIGLGSVTEYNLLYRVMGIPLLVITAILPIVWPMLSVAWNRGDKIWIKQKLLFFGAATLVMFLTFLLITANYGAYFIDFWTKGVLKLENQTIIYFWFLPLTLSLTYWVSTFLHSISDFKFEFYCHIGVALSIALLGFGGATFLGLTGLVFAITVSWLLFGLVPMLYRTIVLLKNEKEFN